MRRLPPAATAAAGIAVPERVEDTGPLLSRLLHENCLPFWFPSCIDAVLGGYELARDERGRTLPRAWERSIVTQSRMVWFFSRLVMGGHGGAGHLEAAAHGFRFMRDRMWDERHGGFLWSVDARSGRPVRDGKHLYAQAFGLFGLSRYAAASGDREAAALARALAHLVRRQCHDSANGGYVELFARDWSPWHGIERGYLSVVPAGTKRYNTHLHWFEALVEYVDLLGDNDARSWLAELAEILTDRVVRHEHAAATDAHGPDWKPMPDMTIYGHDVEAVWLLRDGERRTGAVGGDRLARHLALFDTALRWGWDRVDGGFYWNGPPGAPATGLGKPWWTQAEALVAALWLYLETKRPDYAGCYLRTLDWIVNRQVDWRGGEWHGEIAANGRALGDKASGWKAAYHNGRALMTCLEMLAGAPREA